MSIYCKNEELYSFLERLFNSRVLKRDNKGFHYIKLSALRKKGFLSESELLTLERIFDMEDLDVRIEKTRPIKIKLTSKKSSIFEIKILI